MNKQILNLPENIVDNFIYVDCGARGESRKSLLEVFTNSKYIGFEPDEDECIKLNLQAKEGYSFFPIAVGKRTETASLYITQNPGCSSLLEPNHDLFENFMELGSFFHILDTQLVKLVSLDEYLLQHEINHIDFLELDTQGTELDILQGSEKFLSESVIGIRVEVEFQPMYRNQPLFSDVDTYLRQFGFILFDLQRYHLRRKSCPPDIQSQEQIVWGQALYFWDYKNENHGAEKNVKKLSKLAMVASYYGFHSYALEIIEFLLDGGGLSLSKKTEIQNSRREYVATLKPYKLTRLMVALERSPFKRLFHLLGSIFLRLSDTYHFVARKRKYVWKD